MLPRILTISFILFVFTSHAQYKNDNTKFKTVFLEDLCKTLQNNNGYILLDVRSKGEYCDTSSATNLNIGHLKNAINIDVSELPQRLKELQEDKDKPIFVYCSHSQRSRRASALLADSGFSKIYNVNGGLTTFNILKESGIPCSSSFYETANKFNLVSPDVVITTLEKNKNVFILDVRKDSVFNGISRDDKLNSYGKLKNAVNIPLSTLSNSLGQIPANSKIIIVDDYGNESPKAADILLAKGYKDISIVFNGMDRWAGTPAGEAPGREKYWVHPGAYHLLSADDFDELAKKNSSVIILDVRTADEYNNKSAQSFRNIGNIKKAKNIPVADLSTRMQEINDYKSKPVVIYAFSGSPEMFTAARQLSSNGFTNVNVLMGGLFNLRWRAANIKGKAQLKDWVENIPADNL